MGTENANYSQQNHTDLDQFSGEIKVEIAFEMARFMRVNTRVNHSDLQKNIRYLLQV